MPGICRRPPVRVTPELTADIERLSGYGILQVEIARRLGCSQSTVARVQAAHAIPHFNRSTAQRHARAMA